MTPLRFRAFDKEHGIMMSHEDIDRSDKEGLIMWSELFNGREKDIVVMQSTGLKDSQGREIYEGDVIRWDDASDGEYWRVAEVVWSEKGCWCFRTIPELCVQCHKDEPHYFEMGSFIYTPDTGTWGNVMEVIGNVHQNPDLLPKAS